MRAFKVVKASLIVFCGLGALAVTGCMTAAGGASPEDEALAETRAADDSTPSPCGTAGNGTTAANDPSQDQGAPSTASPPDGTTPTPAQGTATAPPDGSTTAPPAGTTTPAQGAATAPPQGTATAPPQGTTTAPPQGEPGVIGGPGVVGDPGVVGPVGGPIVPPVACGGACGCCTGVCLPSAPAWVLGYFMPGTPPFCFRW
jgi:hypothetical protein